MTTHEPETSSLQPRDLLPMFSVAAYPDGAHVAYRDIWQRRILLLILVKPDDPGNADYLASLRGTGADMPEDTSIVVTTDEIPGLPSPAAVVADQWGEIYSLTPAPSAASLPPATELADWVRFVAMQCPECQGEVK